MDDKQNQTTKPKRQLTEKQLKALAENRKRALETLAKKKAITQALKEEKRKELDAKYEEVKKKQSSENVEVVDEDEPTDVEDEVPVHKPLKKTTPAPRPIAPQEPNFKQLYYKAKLERLSAAQQQQHAMYQYAQAPPQIHAYDVAKQNLAQTANAEVYKYAFNSIFPTG